MKLTAFLTLLVSFCLNGYGQGIAAGLRGGIALSNLTGEESPIDFESKVGYSISGFLEVASNDLFALQPEINISLLGARRQEFVSTASTVQGGILESNLNITSVQVPLLAKFSTGYDFRIYGVAGPMLGIKIAENLKGTYRPGVPSGVPPANPVEGEADISTNLVQNYFGFTVGAGGVYENFVLDVRYTLGISDITEDTDNQITPTDTNNRMNVLTISAGYIWIF